MIYEYKCNNCGNQFEKSVSKREMETTDYKTTECTECKATANKIISNTSVSFKCEHTPKFYR